MQSIELEKLEEKLPLAEKERKKYKINFHNYNSVEQPLSAFVRSREEFHEWNRWGGGKYRHLNRDYSFALIQFPFEQDIWLFGGIYKVSNCEKKEHFADDRSKVWICNVELEEKWKEHIGRLKIHYKKSRRPIQNLEKCYSKMYISETLKELYTGEKFCGYENICHSFKALQHIWRIEKSDWKEQLTNIQGVYLITDTKTGKLYVGSAYGENRIWGRWRDYFEHGHGDNQALIKLMKSKKKKYAEDFFQFSLLEYWKEDKKDAFVIQRENHWKDALCSRQHGYNQN